MAESIEHIKAALFVMDVLHNETPEVKDAGFWAWLETVYEDLDDTDNTRTNTVLAGLKIYRQYS